jgi:hypothetical protein
MGSMTGDALRTADSALSDCVVEDAAAAMLL